MAHYARGVSTESIDSASDPYRHYWDICDLLYLCNGLLRLNINKETRTRFSYGLNAKQALYSILLSHTPGSYPEWISATPRACWGAQDRDVLSGRVWWTDWGRAQVVT